MADTLNEIIPDNDQTRARREHLKALRALVGNAYPNGFARSKETVPPDKKDKIGFEDTITSVVEKFKHLAPQVAGGAKPTPEQLQAANDELNKIELRISGRLATPPRVMGKAAFVHVSDGKSRLQTYVRRDEAHAVSNDTGAVIDEPESGWRLFQLLDHGDFVGVAGFLFVTKTGELSVHVRELQLLAKALVPMPDKLHGIADPELVRRMRYVDLIASSLKIEREEGELSTREVFELRSKLITQMRAFLDAHGYVEVETPMLSPVASGAAARPFKTHHNALGIDLYARIAPELYLKRLLVGGFERVYELNRNFRNEGIGYRWNPEFTMLEFYCAYMDAEGMMDFCEELLRTTIERAVGSARIPCGNEEIDFGQAISRLSMKDAIATHPHPAWPNLGDEKFERSWLDDPQRVRQLSLFNDRLKAAMNVGVWIEEEKAIRLSSSVKELWQEAKQEAAAYGISEVEDAARQIETLFGELAEPKLKRPTFITDFPKLISPLSKASPADPSIAERFELFIAGMEVANGFSELNDPVEQYERFLDQQRQRERGDEEAMQMDTDYVRALSYGMPPAAGIGIGIDRLVMLLTNRRSIRDVILFPHMRPAKQAEESAQPQESNEWLEPDERAGKQV